MRQNFLGDLRITGHENLARAGVDQIFGENVATYVLDRYFQLGEASLIHISNVSRSNSRAFLNNRITFTVANRETCSFTTQSAGNQIQAVGLTIDIKGVGIKKLFKYFFSTKTQRPQQYGSR